MHILRQGHDLPFLPTPNEVALILDDALPPTDLITSALTLAFSGHNILMTNLNSRGWDIPGGHVEIGESPEEALHREVMEETGALLSHVRLLGYQRIRLFSPLPTQLSLSLSRKLPNYVPRHRGRPARLHTHGRNSRARPLYSTRGIFFTLGSRKSGAV